MTPKEMALLLAQAMDSKKGKDIRVLETDGVTTLAAPPPSSRPWPTPAKRP